MTEGPDHFRNRRMRWLSVTPALPEPAPINLMTAKDFNMRKYVTCLPSLELTEPLFTLTDLDEILCELVDEHGLDIHRQEHETVSDFALRVEDTAKEMMVKIADLASEAEVIFFEAVDLESNERRDDLLSTEF